MNFPKERKGWFPDTAWRLQNSCHCIIVKMKTFESFFMEILYGREVEIPPSLSYQGLLCPLRWLGAASLVHEERPSGLDMLSLLRGKGDYSTGWDLSAFFSFLMEGCRGRKWLFPGTCTARGQEAAGAHVQQGQSLFEMEVFRDLSGFSRVGVVFPT